MTLIQCPDWIALAISLVAPAKSGGNFFQAREPRRTTREVQVQQIVPEVRDMLGGERGPDWIVGSDHVTDRRTLELVRPRLM